MEEGQVHPTQNEQETPYAYNEHFPALPESLTPAPVTDRGQWNNKMRVGLSVITQVFRVPADERKFDQSNSFGEKESMRTCANIMKDTGAVIEIFTSKDHSLTFVVTGKSDNVQEAKRKILSSFQTQGSAKLAIPKEHHHCILGKAGARLKDLEKATATKISVPLKNDPSEEITVTGTKEGIEKALHEMQVISDEQSKKAFARITVKKHFHPFVAGANNENVSNIMAETGAKIHIPPASSPGDEIKIAGEKEGVAAAKEKILSFLATVEKYSTVSVEVPKMQHKYVFGSKGTGIAEILQSTGVSVEMPPLDSQKETITLRGPQEKLGSALTIVYQRANSMQAATVDAPSWIHKYIIGRKGANIKQITQDLSKVHVLFTEKEGKITIEGAHEEVELAKNKITELAAEMFNKLTYATLSVDARHFKHIIGKNGTNVNRLREQYGVIINKSDSDPNVIRIEGDKDGVAAAKQELEEKIAKMEMEKEKDAIIDYKLHKNLIGQKGEAIRETKEKFGQVIISFPPPDMKSDIIKLRGPKEDVDKCHKYLMKKVKEIQENSYSIEIPAYQCHKFIIGKGGSTIKKLREETNTSIEVPEPSKSDMIVVTGKRENVEKAKELISKIQNDLLNIETDEVSIPPKMYNSLIGAGGKLIRSITEDCGNVTIKFPNADSNSDKVFLQGPKDDLKKAKELLLKHVSDLELHSYSADVRANPQHHKYLIGRNGVNISRIRESTHTRIIFPSEKDDDKELITIIGKKEEVEKAKAELMAAIEKMDNVKEAEITVDQRHHRYFVARRCEVLRQIEEEFAGVTISFPRSGVNSDKVTIKGPPNLIDPVKQRIAEIIKDLEELVTITCEIPQREHRKVMGMKGTKVQVIEVVHQVKIKFPERNRVEERVPDESGGGWIENGSEQQQAPDTMVNGDSNSPNPSDLIFITGKPQNCEGAKQALLDRVPIVEEMAVPIEYHKGIIGRKGRNVRDMMINYDVHIDVPSQEQQQDIIRITGSPAAIKLAKEGIIKEMKKIDEENEDRALKSFKLTLEVDPEHHPKIIGKRGAIINKIRLKHDVQIGFPKRNDPDENIITIVGYEKNAKDAKDDILAIVNELDALVKDEFEIDSRVHSRLIGARGWAIKEIMKKYQVEIRFPRSGCSNPNLVTVIGEEDCVMKAKDHLLNLEEEYLQEVDDVVRDRTTSIDSFFPRSGGNSASGGGTGAVVGEHEGVGNLRSNNGFIVKGAPWEQTQPTTAPDTASTQEFPSIGAPAVTGAVPPSWGPNRR